MTGGVLVEIIGYCHAGSEDIAALIAAGRAQEVVHLGGNFVAIGKRGPEVWIVASPYGVIPYFYSTGKDRFTHGSTAGAVIRAAKVPWQWNFEAVANQLALEHLIKDETLHTGITRTPPGSVLHWDGTALTISTSDWREIHDRTQADGDPDRMVTSFAEEIARCAGPSNVMSASGGFDSRVILAALLAGGWKPELVVAGAPDGTDRAVVESIGRKFGLKVHPIPMTTEDSIAAGNIITAATSGTKPMGHWHTYIFPAKSGFTKNDRFFVGANGEFLRSYYLDKGILSYAANCLPPHIGLTEFWKRKAKAPFNAGELTGTGQAFGNFLQENRAKLVARFAGTHPDGSLMRRLDHFYLRERVRHFIGNGIALYNLSVSARTPFLDPAWVAQAERLPRKWKLGSAWHRHAIAKLCPQLLEFPEDHVGPTMAANPVPFYWLPQRRKVPVIGYFDYKKHFADPRVLALLSDNAPAIAEMIDPKMIDRIIAEQRASGPHTRTISILIALAVWARGLRAQTH